MNNFREMLRNGSRIVVRKHSKLLKYERIIYSFEARDLEIRICNYLREIFRYRDFMNTLRDFVKSVFAHIFAKFKYFAKKNYINVISRSRTLK